MAGPSLTWFPLLTFLAYFLFEPHWAPALGTRSVTDRPETLGLGLLVHSTPHPQTFHSSPFIDQEAPHHQTATLIHLISSAALTCLWGQVSG